MSSGFWPSALLFLLLGSFLVAQDISQTTQRSPSGWSALRETLLQAKAESDSLEKRLGDLQADNSVLLTLSATQADSLRAQSEALSELETSLTRLSTSLTISREQAVRLEARMNRFQLAVYIGIPGALIAGVIIGAVVTP